MVIRMFCSSISVLLWRLRVHDTELGRHLTLKISHRRCPVAPGQGFVIWRNSTGAPASSMKATKIPGPGSFGSIMIFCLSYRFGGDHRPETRHEALASRVLVMCSPRQIASIGCRKASQGDLRRAPLGVEDRSLRQNPPSWESQGGDNKLCCSKYRFFA